MVTNIGAAQFGTQITGATTPVSSRPGETAVKVEPRASNESLGPAVDQPGDKASVKLDPAALAAAVEEMTKSAQALQRSLEFSVHENSGRTVITVLNKDTQEIVRQIPSEEVLSLSDYFKRNGGLIGDLEA
jgi:flagellar protein FlaG